MDYVDTCGDYKVYRNKDGFLEGFKTTGTIDHTKQQSGGNVNHVVTTATTINEFQQWVKPKAELKTKSVPPPELFT
jgi:hypothetical protein